MRQLLLKFWQEDCGALIATEWVFVATILVLGSITGLVMVRQSVISELGDFANAVMALEMGYSISGQSNCQSSTVGSEYISSVRSILTAHKDPLIGEQISSIQQAPCD